MANRVLKYTTVAGADFEIEDDSGVSTVIAESINVASGAFYVDNANSRTGIGITSPVALLHIHNSGVGVGDHAYAHFTTGDSGSSLSDGLTIGYTAANKGTITQRDGNQLEIQTAFAGPVTLGTDSTEALRVDANQNIGVGVTPESGWGSEYTSIQFGGIGSLWAFTSQSANSVTHFSSNVYYDGTNWRYIVEDEAIDVTMVGGRFNIKTAASGAADTTVNFGNTKFGVENDGTIVFGTHSAIGAETVTGYITIQDSGGASRKLAVVS